MHRPGVRPARLRDVGEVQRPDLEGVAAGVVERITSADATRADGEVDHQRRVGLVGDGTHEPFHEEAMMYAPATKAPVISLGIPSLFSPGEIAMQGGSGHSSLPAERPSDPALDVALWLLLSERVGEGVRRRWRVAMVGVPVWGRAAGSSGRSWPT